MILHLAASILSALALLSTTTLADLTCKQYVPRGHSKSNSGVITYSSQYGDTSVPATNLQVANPAILNSKVPGGSTFKFQTCNSTSMGFSAYSDEGEGYDAGCPTSYIDYVRIISPTSGDCLTAKPIPNSNLFDLVPKKCDPNPTTTAQIFMTNQVVLYSCFGDGTPPSYSAPGFFSMDANNPYGDLEPCTSWALAANNKTVQYFAANSSCSDLTAIITVS